jgi:hypothetical protein
MVPFQSSPRKGRNKGVRGALAGGIDGGIAFWRSV